MRRVLALVVVAACFAAAPALAGSIGIGAFGGMTYPVMQTDVGNGSLYGVRVPVKLVPFVAVEPWYASTSLGDKVQDVAGVNLTYHGFDETAYGANVLLSMGGPLSFYPFGGVSRVTLKHGTNPTLTAYGGGLGLGVSPVPKVSFDLRAEYQGISDGGTTRKFANVTIGATYALFSMP